MNAAPDGYALYYGAAVPISPIFLKNNFIEADKSFSPVSNILVTPFVFGTSGKLPINSLQDLQAYSKANPGKLNFGSSASNQVMLMEVLKARAGITYVNIPYNGGSGALIRAMLGGEISIALSNPSGWGSTFKAGTVRPLFVTTAKRIPSMPTIPTAAEIGIPNFVVGHNIGLWAPRGTPSTVIQQLSALAIAAVRSPEIAEKLRGDAIGVEPYESTPEEQLRIYAEESKFFSDAARLSNFQPR